MKSVATNPGFSEEGKKDPAILANNPVNRWERKVLAIPIPFRQQLVTLPELPLLWPILYLDFSFPVKVVLFLFGTEGWHARSDTAWYILNKQTTEYTILASSIIRRGIFNSEESENWLCLDQTLPSETSSAHAPIIKSVHFEILAPRQPPFSCQSCFGFKQKKG